MPRKTKIIFISVFIILIGTLVGIVIGMRSSSPSSSNTNDGTNGNYQGFNPFGTGGSNATTGNGQNGGQNGSGGGEVNVTPGAGYTASGFSKITDFAVSGATIIDDTRPIPEPEQPADSKNPSKPKFETVPALRYVERATGHIYEMYLDTKAVGEISNSTIPSIYEALFDSKGSTVLYRYLSDDDTTIQTYLASLGGSSGEFLPNNIIDISLSPDKTKFFYLSETSNGVFGSIRAFNETKKTQVFSSAFTEWLSQWVGPQKIYLTSKASFAAKGILMSLNTSTGTLSKVLGPISGLTTRANNVGTFVLYSSSDAAGPSLHVYNTGTRAVQDLGLYGLPEKCAWASDNVTIYCGIPNNGTGTHFPDVWYQGQMSFNDSILKINASTGDITTIANSENVGTAVDVTYPFLDKTGTALYFINKKDSTLWSLNLTQ